MKKKSARAIQRTGRGAAVPAQVKTNARVM
jgi:hypothetical protein